MVGEEEEDQGNDAQEEEEEGIDAQEEGADETMEKGLVEFDTGATLEALVAESVENEVHEFGGLDKEFWTVNKAKVTSPFLVE